MILNTCSPIMNKNETPIKRPSLTLLLVDDNPINLRLLRKTLLSIFNIRHMDFASDGYHALRLLEHHHYDAMLLDIDMPVMNGVETTEFIRRPTSCILSVNRSIPIIAVTTNDSSEARRLYQHVGMDACLSKPIKAGQLKSQLLELLNQSSSL